MAKAMRSGPKCAATTRQLRTRQSALPASDTKRSEPGVSRKFGIYVP